MPKQREVSLLEYAIAKGGFRNGNKAMTYIVQWGICREFLEHDPEIEEYAEWWKVSLATAYRDQQYFRQVFEQHETPAAIWSQVRDHVQAKKDLKTAKRRELAMQLVGLRVAL